MSTEDKNTEHEDTQAGEEVVDSGSTDVEVREGESSEPEIDDAKSAPADRETEGPFDVAEVPAMRPYVDLGGIKVAPREGLQLRLEVEERTSRVVAVSLDYAGSVLQVQAFAAPKTTGLWGQVRAELTQQMTAQGAKVSEEQGPLGTELLVRSQAPAGQGGGESVVRFIAVDGPRWMLRGVIMGKAASDEAKRADTIELFRELVVVRGDQPMPPSELIPLKVPAGVQTGNQPGAAGGQDPVQQA
ncbi:DUF3710 domain-containing protein [Leucobacter insecticola]|uniref:DUF3710 domain-containing protein n=1 Tax=Leucobacter insecticola TaxID=2714934 RepID=A0A6G8FJL6_9MICO|nr:DUF3710 domain-containing protein [Leucobacter insecticola]QIM16565.1 DUF3710 domain-containing protein [Leucobacter insecticola]